jgi:hypothetical protein
MMHRLPALQELEVSHPRFPFSLVLRSLSGPLLWLSQRWSKPARWLRSKPRRGRVPGRHPLRDVQSCRQSPDAQSRSPLVVRPITSLLITSRVQSWSAANTRNGCASKIRIQIS